MSTESYREIRRVESPQAAKGKTEDHPLKFARTDSNIMVPTPECMYSKLKRFVLVQSPHQQTLKMNMVISMSTGSSLRMAKGMHMSPSWYRH